MYMLVTSRLSFSVIVDNPYARSICVVGYSFREDIKTNHKAQNDT